ncbi:putative HTH-type transcriptional regulator YfiR [Roseovarius sp. THAF27]|uniref:TetR/AcrR family transcriptional regulator n=1 Tax=Roseovarius sp. THAF27 TaxID=2587850 RepID=UPI0012A9546F|nr:TetR/AcrR family transcriptional regulator [Roseovarius sp. THAF27]QFT82006.1 putative HTH-type transcriptional regulator YfiR [Roseovarius sp. THAF27]
MQDQSQKNRKRRQRRKDARPTEIIQAAMDLWKERGFSATRLEDVAAGAGIAKGTIYLYFPSKEALFEAAVEERLVANMQSAEQVVASFDGTTEELLLGFFDKIRGEMVEGGAFIFLKVLLSEGHRFPDLVSRYENTVMKRGIETVRCILRRGIDRGELRSEAAEYDPLLIMAPAMMLSLWGTVFPGITAPDAHQVLRQHVGMLLASFGKE